MTYVRLRVSIATAIALGVLVGACTPDACVQAPVGTDVTLADVRDVYPSAVGTSRAGRPCATVLLSTEVTVCDVGVEAASEPDPPGGLVRAVPLSLRVSGTEASDVGRVVAAISPAAAPCGTGG